MPTPSCNPSFGGALPGRQPTPAGVLSEISSPIARAPLAAMVANAVLPLIPEKHLIATAQEGQGGNGDRSYPEKFEAWHGYGSELRCELPQAMLCPTPIGNYT